MRLQRWLGYGACAWALLFAAPHTWWALGVAYGFPGGDTNYQVFMSSTWRYLYNLSVIVLSGLAILAVLLLLRPSSHAIRRTVLRAAVWIGGGTLAVRGVAGLIVDGTSDPVWWPTFLAGGVLMCAVAYLDRHRGLKRIGLSKE